MSSTELTTSRDLETRVHDRELDERAKILFDGTRIGAVTSLVVGLLLVFLLNGAVPSQSLQIWSAFHVSVHVAILALLRRCCADHENPLEPAQKLQRLEYAGMARGFVWALASVLIFPIGHPFKIALFVVIIAGLCSGAMSTLAASLRGLQAFTALASLPIAFRLVSLGSVSASSVALIVSIYPLIISAGARRIHDKLRQIIRLQEESSHREDLLENRSGQLKESEEKYRLLFELSEDPMWLIDGENFVMANVAAARFLEYDSLEELSNVHPGALSPPTQPNGEDSFQLAQKRMEFAHKNGYHRFEWIHRTKNGKDITVEVTLTRIPFRGHFALFCVWRDISERKWTEQALQIARSRAEEASNAKSEFLATMSHEIRTPLNAVLGMSELLAEAELPEDASHWASTIHKSGQALLMIINDILDFSKIEAGRMDLQPEPTDLFDLVQAVHDVFSVPAELAALEFNCGIEDGCPRYLDVDPGRLRQVILNLCGNAIKFTEIGSVSIEVSGVALSDSRARIEIAVRDTGKGISPEVHARLFEPFRQADGSTSRKYGGTGLGLAISQRIVEQMGGRIDLHSEVGEGSVFTVVFHADVVSENAIPESLSGDLIAIGTELSGKILVVEDVPANQLLAKAMLAKLGLEVEVAANGIEGLQAYDGGDFDAILMDCQMPEMDGFEATKSIRVKEAITGTRIPIIALTANALDRDRKKCLAAGMDDFLAKPFQKAQLEKVLARWLATVESV